MQNCPKTQIFPKNEEVFWTFFASIDYSKLAKHWIDFFPKNCWVCQKKDEEFVKNNLNFPEFKLSLEGKNSVQARVFCKIYIILDVFRKEQE